MFVYGDQRTLITSQIEHHAILHSAATIERMGYPVVYLPVNSDGILSIDTLNDYISESTIMKLVLLNQLRNWLQLLIAMEHHFILMQYRQWVMYQLM